MVDAYGVRHRLFAGFLALVQRVNKLPNITGNVKLGGGLKGRSRVGVLVCYPALLEEGK